MPTEWIASLIRASTFHRDKASQVQDIARRTVDEFAGDLPADSEVRTSLRGVGPKCANLALGVAGTHICQGLLPLCSSSPRKHVSTDWRFPQ